MMKKFKSFMLIAAAALIGFSSCNNDPIDPYVPVTGAPDGAEIAVSFAFLRAVGDSQSESTVRVQDGVVILTQGNVITASQTVAAVTNASPDVIFTQVPASNQAWFVGNTNIPVGLLENGQQITGVLNHMLYLELQAGTGVGAPDSGGPGGPGTGPAVGTNQQVVNVVGSGAITPTANTNPNTGAVIHTAQVIVEPTLARVEIFNITGNQFVDEFTVEGIFLDTYFEEARVGGLPRIETLRVRGTGEPGSQNYFQAGAAGAFTTNWANVPTVWTGIVYDEVNLTSEAVNAWTGEFHPALLPNGDPNPLANQPVMANLHRVVPTDNNPLHVWGYNLFANNSQTPRIAIRLSEIYINEEVVFNVLPVPAITQPVVFPAEGPYVPGVHRYIYVPAVGGYQRGLFYGVDGAGDNVYGHATDLNYWYTEVIPAVPGITLTGTARMPHPDSRDRVTAVAELTAEQIIAANPNYTNQQVLDALIANREAMYEQDGTPLFISIRGFAGVNRDTGFQARRVYQLGSYTHPANADRNWYLDGGGNGAWTFGPENVTTIPFERPIDVHVSIELRPWIWVPVTPDLVQ